MPALPPHPRFRSSPSSCATSRASSASLSDDENAITPAGPEIITPATAPAPLTDAHRYGAGVSASRRRRQLRPLRSSMDDNDDDDNIDAVDGRRRHRHRHRPASRASSNADVPSLDLDGACCSDDAEAGGVAPEEVSLAPGLDTISLWNRMLAVQRAFHCYNSARISAALDDEVLRSRVPSRACLDLLNDSISLLPDDEREQVLYFIEHGEAKPQKRRSLWRSFV